jgi:hypothetical protein
MWSYLAYVDNHSLALALAIVMIVILGEDCIVF